MQLLRVFVIFVRVFNLYSHLYIGWGRMGQVGQSWTSGIELDRWSRARWVGQSGTCGVERDRWDRMNNEFIRSRYEVVKGASQIFGVRLNKGIEILIYFSKVESVENMYTAIQTDEIIGNLRLVTCLVKSKDYLNQQYFDLMPQTEYLWYMYL